jgi:hypothetical protein
MQSKEFYCTDCGCSNPIGFSFCAKCGKKFSYTCPDCNTEVTPDTKYCTLCGAELVWNIPPAKPQASAPVPHSTVRPVEMKIAPVPAPAAKPAVKPKKRRFNFVPWIIIFVLIIAAIVLLLNFESLFK